MTFGELADLIFSCGNENALIYAFEYEGDADQFVSSGERSELAFIHSSIYKASVTLREEWCNASVLQIVAKAQNEFVVVAERTREVPEEET